MDGNGEKAFLRTALKTALGALAALVIGVGTWFGSGLVFPSQTAVVSAGEVRDIAKEEVAEHATRGMHPEVEERIDRAIATERRVNQIEHRRIEQKVDSILDAVKRIERKVDP